MVLDLRFCLFASLRPRNVRANWSPCTAWLLSIHLRPLGGEGLVIQLLRLVYDHMAPTVRKTKWNAQKILEPRPEFLPPLGRYEEQHESAATRSEKLATDCAGTASGCVDFVEGRVCNVLRQCSFQLPAFVQ